RFSAYEKNYLRCRIPFLRINGMQKTQKQQWHFGNLPKQRHGCFLCYMIAYFSAIVKGLTIISQGLTLCP
ncbi:MAG: hypothetical protein J5722_10875, partial [Oscillospiraceae bacterium]|nr:hypothetical protein [Oscillospiraceae bacterium]